MRCTMGDHMASQDFTIGGAAATPDGASKGGRGTPAALPLAVAQAFLDPLERQLLPAQRNAQPANGDQRQ